MRKQQSNKGLSPGAFATASWVFGIIAFRLAKNAAADSKAKKAKSLAM